jgi:hypothetical protein
MLPNPFAMQVALYGLWGIVLASAALLISARLARTYRLAIAGVVMLWTLMPGSLSPAYWLGLAFQTPSLMSAAICVHWLFTRQWCAEHPVSQPADDARQQLNILLVSGILLGWLLLLDTLAWWPVQVYAWGFGSLSLGVLALLAALLWVLRGSALPLVVLALFVVSRLPTGNVFDALLDPWLWFALQLGGLIKGAAHLRVKRGGLPATRV